MPVTRDFSYAASVSSLESKFAPFPPAIKLRQLRTVLQVVKLHFPHIELAYLVLHATQVFPGKFGSHMHGTTFIGRTLNSIKIKDDCTPKILVIFP